MIINSYHILDCNKNISHFDLFKRSIADTDSINDEIKTYHDNNNFEITESNSIIDNQKIINNKFIFKKGYFFCSYIYHLDNNYYITEPNYEYKNNPFCPKNEFTNIVISNTVPLNLNIVAVIYYYKYLSDKDESQCKTNVFTFVEKKINHYDNEKYVIDIVYFNTLHNNIKYSLTYIYYKSINFTNLKRQTYKKTLKYNYVNYKNDDKFNKLSTVIENTIYKDTKKVILDLQISQQNLQILINLNNTTKIDSNSLFNLLLEITKATFVNSSIETTNNILNKDCNINIYSNFSISNDIIINSTQIILNDITQLFSHIKKLENEYLLLIENIYSLNDFGNILKNENEFIIYRNIFNDIIEKKGNILEENNLTIYGLKPIILNLINKINRDISNLNNLIDTLKNDLGDNILNNNDLLDKIKNTIQSFMNFEINMNSINNTLIENNKLKIFIKLKNNTIEVYNNKILDKYKKNIIIDEDYTIKNLKNINVESFSEKLIKDFTDNNNSIFNFTIKNIFKFTEINIEHIYSYITNVYNYLDTKSNDLAYPTLYDIFYNTKNIEYKDYIKNPVNFKNLFDKFCTISEDKQVSLLQKNYESIFKPLPKNDNTFLNMYKKRNNILKLTSKNPITVNTNVFLDINNYFEHYINSLNYKILHFSDIKNLLTFNRKQITRCCNTLNVINQHNKHIDEIIKNTEISVNTLKELRNSKKFENLSVEQQNYIKLFLKINTNIFSIFNKYINLYNYNITNNFYSISIKNFSNFISLVDTTPITEEMEILNIFYSLKNCFELKETNKNILDEFIIICYCFSISMLSEHPIDYFRFLFNLNKNEQFNKMFSEILHNKIYLYTENNTNYIKIVSSVSELILSEYILTNNINNVNDTIKLIKTKLIEELNKGNLINIVNKLSVIQYFISNESNKINTIKKYTSRNKYNDIDTFFKMINKYKIRNFNTNINKLVEQTNNYKINTSDETDTSLKYCISIEENNKYECDVCDFSKKPLVKNLNNCPVNLPYNLDISINNHLNSELAFEADTYRIFSYVSEPKKQLIYKRGRILYGEPKSDSDIYEWNINKNYKSFTLLGTVDNNEDDPIIIKTNSLDSLGITKEIKDDLNIIYNNTNEFYLNNFNIKNIVSSSNLNNVDFKFPNSHQLYTKKVQNYYYIYFIENDIKYYMYSNVLTGKSNYDIVWREETYSSTQPFIKNYAKWRLIKTSEYVGNLFEDPRTLYNMRSLSYFDINEYNVIKGLVSNNNTCFKYDILLNNYLNKNFDLINNTKFKLTGFNNNYNIAPYIKNNKSIFNDLSQLQFLNYIKMQQSINKKELKQDTNYNISDYNNKINMFMNTTDSTTGSVVSKVSIYLIKNPENETYLYLDSTRNIIEFIPLFEDTLKDESKQLSKNDFIPDEFLWIIQDSSSNDKLIKNKIKNIENKYNTMIDQSITNLNNNIESKKNKIKFKGLIDSIEKKNTQTGGNIIKINSDNISNINNTVKELQYIKYNDYILLLKQLNLVKENSKQVLETDLFYENVNNRGLITYIDYFTKTKQSIFIYFNYDDNKFTCNLDDIINITSITFNLKRIDKNKELKQSDMEIIIDNNNFNISNNITIIQSSDNNYDNIEISIPNSINTDISQIFIYINDYEFNINIRRGDVIVYYNNNPIYNKLKQYTINGSEKRNYGIIKNTTVNSTFDIFNSLNIGKSNKTVYDFSVKLLADTPDKLKSKLYTLNKNIIIENITTYNNVIGEFYVKKNKLKNDVQYNSKIFYISNDRNILYINIFTQNLNEPIYSIPCKYQNQIENKNTNDIYKYICSSIYTHIILLETSNKSEVINNIFNFIIVLYKNSNYNEITQILKTSEDIDPRGFTFNSTKELNLYFNIEKINNNTLLPDKINIVFDKIINSNYINFDMKYTNFILLQDLYNNLLNLQFIKLNSLIKNQDKYSLLLNKTKSYINYINNIKNNIDNRGIDNILDILSKDNTFNIFNLIKYYFVNKVDSNNQLNEDFKKELELYLYNLFVSNNNINNYLINLLLTVTQKIQNIYTIYTTTINDLLNEDNRFLDCKYTPGSIIDIIYNFIKFFSNYEENSQDMSFFEVKHGFYYKNNEDVFVNYVKNKEELSGISNNIYLTSFNDIIRNYNKIYPQLIQKNIRNKKLNQPYFETYNTYINNIKSILEELLNIKYNNIKLNESIRVSNQHTSTQNKLKQEYINKNKNKDQNIINYTHLNLNSNINDKKIVKGDVVLYKFKKEVKTNNFYNIINLLLPNIIKTNEWKIFNEFKNITISSNNINNIINKYLNIYSIANYNELFKSDLIDSYIIQENLLLKEIYPFTNKINNEQKRNICYFKLENDSIYLHLNDYKYKVTLKKLIYSNLYLIIKNVNNINYYLEFKFEEGFYNYNWVKEDYNMLDNIINKLVFINIEQGNITEVNTSRVEILEKDMIMIEYEHRFKNIYSHLNKFINNSQGSCNLLNTYYTIYSKKYGKLIDNNNLTSILNLSLNKSGSSYILKDQFSAINQNIGNNKFYLSNYECNSYIIYNSYKNIILENSNTFIELNNIGLTLKDILTNIDNYKNYNINLKYNKNKDLFYELNEYCSLTKNSNKFKIQNKSDNEKKARNNNYYIYSVSKDGNKQNIFEKYKKQVGLTETVLEDDMIFNIIPINSINKKNIQVKNSDKLEDTELNLIPVDQHSEYYLISNKKNEYLRVNKLIDYKKPLRVSLEFVQTNKINMDYLWYIKNNIENISDINIKNDRNMCMYGGQKLILNKETKKTYLDKINEDYLNSDSSKYNDLCNNNTHVNFINYNMMESQDDVSYIDCRNKCIDDDNCKGFSYSNTNDINKCYLYDNEGVTNTSILYYDCNRSLTENMNIGEIKKGELYNTIDLVDNNLYYIKCKNSTNDKNYIEFNKATSVYYEQNYLKCNTKSNKQDLYSNNIFKLKIDKNNFNNGNIKLFSLLTENKHILGTYIDNNSGNTINITFDKIKNKYVWVHVNSESKWYLESTNNIYEYNIIEGSVTKETNDVGEITNVKCSGEYCCPYYYQGYTTLKINIDSNNNILSAEGPEVITYTKMFNDENVSIFKNIRNLNTIESTNYEGNVFIVENSSNSSTNDKYYNIFSILNNEKYYIYKTSKDSQNNNFIEFNKISDNNNLNNDSYLWNFEIYNNEITNGYSYQKIIVGGDETNPDSSYLNSDNIEQISKESNEQIGGVKKNDLINNNVYYIKSNNDKYLCANKHYDINDPGNSKLSTIAISINSKLALEPNKVRKHNNKFIRASIDLSTKYNISKTHSIDDDILWKLEKVRDNVYKFYNIKHKTYLSNDNISLEIEIVENANSLFYNLKDVSGSSILTMGTNEDINNVNIVELIEMNQIENRQVLWTFVKPEISSVKNPYITDSEFKPLENGKIYRIINQGVKDYSNTNTYLTVNELKNELLIPYNDKLFTSNLKDDPTLWKCIINDDNTYSFICMYNNYKLGNLNNQYSLLKNVGNKLEFKNSDLSINSKYLTDKFYIQHNSNEYYNIINSNNLNYYICGFSNNNNSYDNYELDNIKYTHKVANNSNWLLSCKLEEELVDTNIFTDEPNYYLYSTKADTMKYSISKNYNEIYNDVYYEDKLLNTSENNINKVIKKFKDSFKRYEGFTLNTNIACDPNKNNQLNNYQKDNVSIILTTKTHYYTIRFINFKENSLLIRITNNKLNGNSNTFTTQIQTHNKLFNKLDYKNVGQNKKINLKVCAPDIYLEDNIFKANNAQVNITYDKEFLNIYVNNKLVTFTKIVNTLFEDIYFTSSNPTEWTNIFWYKHKTLLETPLWKTENIDNFKNNKPGIRFISKLNKNVSFNAIIEQKTLGYFYIKDINNKYLSINNKTNNIYNVEFINELPTDDSNCLWRLYDTNINKQVSLKVVNNKQNLYNEFVLDKNNLKDSTNLPDSYIDNVYNSTNFMLKIRLNKENNIIDNLSDYEYSIIDINSNDDVNEKMCYWLNNKNGHLNIEYNPYLAGSHFTTDIWNLQYIMGKNPNLNDKFLVKYKNNKGIIEIADFIPENYAEYGTEVILTLKARWNNFEQIKEFTSIKSQNNIYIDEVKPSDNNYPNACITLNESSTGAYCTQVQNQESCDDVNSVLFIPNEKCDNVLYKNYKLINGVKLTGGNKRNIKGGNIWIEPRFFYLNNINTNGDTIFNNIHNVTYIPEFDTEDTELLKDWTYTDNDSKNIIYTRIFNNFDYDGYIEDKENKIIRAVILPDNFLLFTNDSPVRLEYIDGRMKSYNIEYKNIKVISTDEYFSKYNTYYINIETKIGSDKVLNTDLSSPEYKLNKCYDLITNNICISTSNNNTTIANNISNNQFLLENFGHFKDSKNTFRIINIYGKYLSDLYMNNTHLCSEIRQNDINTLVLQGQYDFINLNKNTIHQMHSTSYESLWKMVYNEENNTYEIINAYTDKLLKNDQGNSELFIEYVDNKYFKQHFVNKTNSKLIYNNEDIYYIYYLDSGNKKYLSYENVLINKKYTKTATIKFSNTPQPFIIQKANYNLDILTDEYTQVPSTINNICYNKSNTCNDLNNIPLILNINKNCLDISYELKQRQILEDNQQVLTSLNVDSFYTRILKGHNNKLEQSPGIYELIFNINEIKLSGIVYAFTTITTPAEDLKVRIEAIDKNDNVTIIKDFTNIKTSQKLLENSHNLQEFDLSNNLVLKFIIKSNSESIKLNYIELFGTPNENKFKRVQEIKNNTEVNKYKPVQINRSLISKKTNIENNLVKIKYVNESYNNSINTDLNLNILGITNTIVDKYVLSDLNIDEVKHKFIITFNALLNCYMFYIENNEYLNLNNSSSYVNGYYFKLIESNSIPMSFDYKLFNIQCYDNENLYINVNENNEIQLGTFKHDFILINTDTENSNLINYNNLINNNILYNFYIKSVYISAIETDTLYYNIIPGNTLTVDNNDKIKLLIKQESNNSWLLMNPNNNTSIIVSNLVNSNDNTYTFTNNNDTKFHRVIIRLFNNYNDLKIYTNESYKKYLSHNDVNKTVDNDKYTESLTRNKKYLTYNLILKDIFLNNIISLKNNGSYLICDNEGFLTDNITLNDAGYFIEIKLDENNLCKLWSYKYKKFIKYDITNNLFKLDKNITEYNNIDTLNDIDIVHTFEKIENSDYTYHYKLYYAPVDTYLNVTNVNSQKDYEIDNITDITEFDYNNYDDYCDKICNNNSNIEDKIMNDKTYNIQKFGSQLNITLGEYKIKILNNHNKYIKYFKINVTNMNRDNMILLNNFKEKNILRDIFSTDEGQAPESLYLSIITVDLSNTNTKNLCNIILWNDNVDTYGRFENDFDRPSDKSLYIDKSLNIIYDSSYNKFDFTNNKTFIFNSYLEKPVNKKYIRINDFNLDIINKFKISLFHYDTIQDNVEIKETDSNQLSNIRKLYTTCSWGECPDYNNISQEEIAKISNNLKKFESKFRGGNLDINMIRFIKCIDNNNIDFYKGKTQTNLSYVDNDSTYFDNSKLSNILFKKNDIVEIHKIFGKRGWTNSYNSLYNKSLFMINKTNVEDKDYYDTFRNIYPISFLQEKFAFNSENLWKENNWFEDNPHFRSLPFWKFEEIQVGESTGSSNIKSLEITGGRKSSTSIRSSKNMSRKKNNTSRFINSIYIILIIIAIYYLYTSMT